MGFSMGVQCGDVHIYTSYEYCNLQVFLNGMLARVEESGNLVVSTHLGGTN